MKIELLNQIIEELQEYSPRKARKLQRLLEEYEQSGKNGVARMKVYNYAYNLFLSFLSRESKRDLTNTNVCINEECYTVERREQGKYHIHMEGVLRRGPKEKGVEPASYISREYQKGFFIVPDGAKTEEEKAELRRQTNFYFNNLSILNEISGYMDHKLEIVTYEYTLKDPNMKRSFTEHLIDFLGLSRIDDKQRKKEENAPQKIKTDN